MKFSAEEAEQAYMQMDALDVDDTNLQAVNFRAEAVVLEQKVSKACQLYQKVRPVLLVLTSLFFVPEKWKNVIRTFTTSMDTFCPPV